MHEPMNREDPPRLEIQDWGQMEYEIALDRQRAMVEDRIAGHAPDRLVLVEHPPAITLGRRATELLAEFGFDRAPARPQGQGNP